VYYRDDRRPGTLRKRRAHRRGLDDLSPGSLHAVYSRAEPLGHVDHARSEHAVDPDHGLVTVLDEIGEAGFHARRAVAEIGSVSRFSVRKRTAKIFLDAIEELEEKGVEVPHERRRHGGGDLGVDHRRAGPEQQARRRARSHRSRSVSRGSLKTTAFLC
jgi:hypothetical protein